VRITRLTVLTAGALVALTAGCGGTTTTPGAALPTTGAATVSTTVSTTASSPPPAPADNGIAALPVKEAFAKAQAALAAANSVRVSATFGSGTDAGTVDVRIVRGRGAVGTAIFSGAKVGLLRRADVVYLHADAANWLKLGAGADGANLLDGKYVKVPGNDKDFAELLDFTSVKGLAALFALPASVPNVAVSWPRTTVRGVPAVQVGDLKEGAIYIAATGKPYPLRARSTTGADRGSVEFLEYNRPVTLPTPAPNQIITLPA
jgi:hypothetical protein